ncbi:hypothetical protein B0H10DRAFT_988893 [Mycena sp. CBHHK59/15]|nr:hypothetical protein B0H10DRAFT_988893 [Mycena sp. CBHHK59/15]
MQAIWSTDLAAAGARRLFFPYAWSVIATFLKGPSATRSQPHCSQIHTYFRTRGTSSSHRPSGIAFLCRSVHSCSKPGLQNAPSYFLKRYSNQDCSDLSLFSAMYLLPFFL